MAHDYLAVYHNLARTRTETTRIDRIRGEEPCLQAIA
jgi:hypothetical protein